LQILNLFGRRIGLDDEVGSRHHFTPHCQLTFNVQAFIRRASSMTDKTSWTKPLACMAYGDSIVGTAWLEAGTAAGAASDRRLRRARRPGQRDDDQDVDEVRHVPDWAQRRAARPLHAAT